MNKKSLLLLLAVMIAALVFPIAWQIHTVQEYEYEYEWRKEAVLEEEAAGIEHDERTTTWLQEYKMKWVMQTVVLAVIIIAELVLVVIAAINLFPKIAMRNTSAVLLLVIAAACLLLCFPQAQKAKAAETEYNSWVGLKTNGIAFVEYDKAIRLQECSGVLACEIATSISYGIICLIAVCGVCVIYSERIKFYANALKKKNVVSSEERQSLKPSFYEDLPDVDEIYHEIIAKTEKQDKHT